MKLRISSTLIALLLSTAPVYAADEQPSGENTDAAEAPKPAPSPALPRIEPNPDSVKLAELAAAYQPSTEVLWLETADEKFLGLKQAHNTEELLGNVLIFHDEQTNADWPKLIRTLRLGLPDKGWATLSIQLPSPPEEETPERTLKSPRAYLPPGVKSATPIVNANEEITEEASEAETAPEQEQATDTPPAETATEQADQETPDSQDETQELATYDSRLLDYGNAALENLQQEEGKLVVLGIGTGAAWAAAVAKEHQDSEKPVTLVLVDSRQPLHPNSPDLLELLPQLTTTVLDLYHNDPLQLTPNSNQAKARVNLARRSNLKNYHHNRLPSIIGDRKKRNDWVMTRVRGFMNTHIIKADKQDNKPEKPNASSTNKAEVAPGSRS